MKKTVFIILSISITIIILPIVKLNLQTPLKSISQQITEEVIAKESTLDAEMELKDELYAIFLKYNKTKNIGERMPFYSRRRLLSMLRRVETGGTLDEVFFRNHINTKYIASVEVTEKHRSSCLVGTVLSINVTKKGHLWREYYYCFIKNPIPQYCSVCKKYEKVYENITGYEEVEIGTERGFTECLHEYSKVKKIHKDGSLTVTEYASKEGVAPGTEANCRDCNQCLAQPKWLLDDFFLRPLEFEDK